MLVEPAKHTLQTPLFALATFAAGRLVLVALEAAREQKCTMHSLWCNRCAAPVVKVVNTFVWGLMMKAKYRRNNTAYWTLQRRWRLQTAGKASNYSKQRSSIHLLHIMIPINWLALEHFIDLHNTTMLWVFFEALAMFMRMFILMWACAHSRSQPKGLSGLKKMHSGKPVVHPPNTTIL